MDTWDRTNFFPSHDGLHVLPNNPFFARLLRHAHRRRVAVRDRNGQDMSKTYGNLLSDALTLRSVLNDSLTSDTRARLRRGEEVYIGVLAAGGYEFAVAMVAVLAIGAAVVPMSKSTVFSLLSLRRSHRNCSNMSKRWRILQRKWRTLSPRHSKLQSCAHLQQLD